MRLECVVRRFIVWLMVLHRFCLKRLREQNRGLRIDVTNLLIFSLERHFDVVNKDAYTYKRLRNPFNDRKRWILYKILYKYFWFEILACMLVKGKAFEMLSSGCWKEFRQVRSEILIYKTKMSVYKRARLACINIKNYLDNCACVSGINFWVRSVSIQGRRDSFLQIFSGWVRSVWNFG